MFTVGTRKDLARLKEFLAKKYSGEAILCKNGRSALALALEAYFQRGDAILINGFTCYAVYEAVRAAGLVPIFVDIDRKSLNFNLKTLGDAISTHTANSKDGQRKIAGIVIQNSLGNPVDIVAIEKFARQHDLEIIEDLAHCAGMVYPDGREAGTVGAASVFSFGKDKSIDTVSGGALVLRHPCKNTIEAPMFAPKISDYLRARLYPIFGMICRGLSYVGIGGAMMRLLVALHWVEKSADNRLDLTRRLAKFEAKLALAQLKNLKKTRMPLRDFYLVRDRESVLKTLQKKGYYFGGFWYEKPVSPERYYQKVHFPEAKCPVAVEVTQKIINFPRYYDKHDLVPAQKIIREYLDE